MLWAYLKYLRKPRTMNIEIKYNNWTPQVYVEGKYWEDAEILLEQVWSSDDIRLYDYLKASLEY